MEEWKAKALKLSAKAEQKNRCTKNLYRYFKIAKLLNCYTVYGSKKFFNSLTIYRFNSLFYASIKIIFKNN